MSLESRFPLTLAQQDIYFDQLHAAESPRYNIGGYIRFGAVDVARLERAHGRMVASHDAFGLRIDASGATPMQYVDGARTLSLAHVDLSGAPDAAAAAEEWLRRTFTTLLPLDRCELFQASLLKLSANEYRYVVVAHHLMIDGWGFSNLARVLGEQYQADGSAEEVPGEVPASWQTRAADDAEYVDSSRYVENGRYWTEHCNPLPEPPLTPFHRARFDGRKLVTSGRKAFFLSRDEYNQLLAAADAMGVGISAWFTALLAGYFHKLTGQNRLILGIPTHNRKTFQQKRQIGVYIGVNPLAVELESGDSFAEVARRIQQVQKKNYRHSRYPIGHTIRGLGLLDPSSRLNDGARRLYDVGFNYLRLDSKFRIGDEVVEIKYLSHEHEATPLSITLFENGDEQPVEIQFDYNHAYFDKDEAALLVHRFGAIVGDAFRRGDFPIGTLMTVAPVDEKIVTPRPDTPFPQQRIHELFEAQAAATPDAIALLANEETLTYRELNERANAIAHSLIARGVTAGELVAICVERSIENIAGTLAILKAGAAYLPLDPSYPVQRLEQMIADSGVRFVLRKDDLRGDSSAVSNPGLAGTPSDLAYVMYTSGSTGLPKGVMVEHRGVVRLVAGNHYVPLDAQTRMLQVSTTAFDAATFEIWGSLLNGGQLVLYPEPLIDLTVLNETLERHAVNTVWLTAGLFEQWSYQLPRSSTSTALRYVLAGGDVLSPAAVARVYRALPDVTVINGYGPTENTTFTCCYAVPRNADLSRPIRLGTNINGTSLHVLDRNGEPVPVGTAGELYAGGAGLARGYWNQPELTAEKFVVLPGTQERLYRTGDLVRYLPDGTLAFLGRIDNQVKLRGFRIEPGEIEVQLGRVEGVREAAVMVRGEGSGKYLAAYLVLDEEATDADVRQSLRQTLPEHMIPAAFVRMPSLPLNANGKVDRHALPEPELQEQHDYAAPETGTETRVAAIWQDVLKLDRVSATANFFELGGHSLLATRVASAIAEAFGKTVPVRALFEHNTIRTLSAHLDGQSGATYRAIPVASRNEPLPASFAQQRLWFIDQLEEGSTQYNMPAALRLTGNLNGAALQSTLDTIVARHEVLRTRFLAGIGIDGKGSAMQDVRPAEAVPMAFVDLTNAPEQLDVLMQQEAERPFDLARDLMLRATVIRLGEDDHVLLLTLHHIAADGWSAGVLVKELTALYEAHSLGIDPELAPLPIQYADYAVWQRNNTALLEPQLAYWKQQLAHAPSVHGLPLDHTRPAQQQFAGRNLQAHLDRKTLDGLQRLANDQGATLFMVLQTAFSLLVSRWSGAADVVVGTPVAGRNQKETEGLIGFFVNTLVLRNELAEELPFTRLLQQGRQNVLDAFSNQDVPFEMLVEELRPERSLSHAPLYQLVFALHNNEPFVLDLPELTIAQLHGEPDTAKFDLTVSATENDRGLDLTWNYATSLFEEQTIARLAASFAVLLDGIVAAPETQAGRLPILPPADAASLLTEITCAKQFATVDTLHQRFERQAAATPDNVAVVFNDEALTYAQLNEKANQLAHALIGRGVQADTLVGICVERSVEMLVGILGILKAGGAYLPLDPDYPAARLQYTIEDAAVGIVLTQAKLIGKVPVANDKLLVIDDASFDGSPRTNPNVEVLPSHLAYVIYTSGSTGNPKGVMIEHRNVTRLMDAADVEFTFGADDAWTLFHSYAFDFSVWEIWGALLYGGRLVVVPFETSRSPEQFYALLQRERITVLNQTPSAFYALADAALGRERLDALRYVVFGGEALVPSRLRAWVAEYGDDQPLINMYGITETTVHVTYRRMLAADCESEVSDIGRPLADLVTWVGSNGALLPIGVPGELYVGGAGLARGYLNKPELTASRFIDNPFGGEGRLYRTGDLVRYRPDLQLEYLGRIDDQVKIRGFRIELGEIKAQLLQHDGVKEALVIARGDGADKRLIAYLVPAEPVEAEGLIDGARRTIKQHLPDYMVPAAFVVMDAFPLTSNGKIDKKALPEPQRQAQSYAAPATATEERLAAIWQEILKLDAVSVTANFFELGGHSLLATRIASAVSEAFGTTMPVRALFEHNTVRTLAAWLDQQSVTGHSEIPVADRNEPLPLSFAQQRLWFIDQLEEGSAQYNMAAGLHLEGALDTNALQQAFNTIIERHEVLRTRFIPHGESSVQDIRDAQPLPMQHHDLSHLPEQEREAALRQLAQEEANRVFNLRNDLMLRVTLVRLGDEAHALLITLHHIAGDGWSVDVLVQELNTLYTAYVRGEQNPLQPLRVQYADYAAWEHARSHGEEFESHVSYWKQQLSDIPPVHSLPLDKPRPAQQVFTGGTVQSRLGGAAYAELLSLAKRENVTPFMLLQTAFALLLGRWSNASDLVIGSPIAGRNHKDLEPLIGFFVNTLVLRTKLDGAMTFDELLEKNRQTILDAFAHQDVAFDALVGELKPERSLSYSPLFQIIFTLQKENGVRLALPGLTAHELERGTEATKFDLHLSAVEEGDGLTLTWSYADSLFEAGTIERMAGSFAVLLDGIAKNPNTSIHRLPLLTDADRNQLALWNETAGEYPTNKHVHELIEAQVLRTPDAIALEAGDQRLTYRELNERANQVAHALVERGVRPDTLVGIYLEPSAETVIAMLAILKAGGAYVPLSATLPEARIRHMLSDGGVSIILTRSTLRERLAFTGVELLALDQSFSSYPSQNLTPSSLGLEPKHLAYVLYTSGTTGQPKGVMISHGAAVNFGTALLDRLALPTVERWLLLTATTFDIAFFEWFGCLQMGGTVVVADESCQFDAAELRRFLEANRFQLVQATPSRWTQLIDAGWVGQQDVVALAGGEPLTFELQQKMASRVGVLWNGYGPTEATVYTCNHKVDPNEPLPHRLSIGTGLRNYEHYILSAHNEPVAIGAIGELHIAGPSLGRGYLKRPELTAEKFITVGNTRLYKTGDLVRFLPNGDIGYIGRTDDQVKIRGFRIELGEIEAQLRRVEGVREGVVLARGEAAGKYLAAYIVAEGELAAADENEWRDILRQSLKQTLPEYMVPAAFVRMSAFPLNSNGKVDKKALPEPERQLEHDYVAPAGTTETRLATIWQEILKLDAVSVTANFFELGGHSLLATRIASAVSEAFGTTMPVRALFEHNTVRTLANWLDQHTGAAYGVIPVVDRSEALPLSFAQQRLWFIDQLEEGSAQYNMAAGLRLEGALDTDALQQAFNTIVERHEVLRTRFIPQGESSVQDIRAAQPLPMQHHDLSHLPELEREAALRQLAQEEANRVFDLRTDLMLRVTLVRLGDEAHALFITLHHIAGDGWSVDVLVQELSALYSAYSRGEQNPLQPLRVQYADYAAWEHARSHGEEFESHVSYWKQQLSDIPPVHSLPLDKPRPAQQVFTGGTVESRLGGAAYAELLALAKRENVTPFMLLQTAFALLLGRWSNVSDLVIGSPIAGRNHKDLEPLIGFFVNTLVLRTKLDGAMTFGELLERNRQTILDAFAHQDVAFDALVGELKPERSLSYSPLFQIIFTLQKENGVRLALPGLTAHELERGTEATKFDLHLSAVENGDGLTLTWSYADSLFEAGTIERMAGSFAVLLDGIAKNPHTSIHRLPLLTDSDRKQLAVWNENAGDYPTDKHVHELIEAQVIKTPDAIALEAGNDRLTYAELNERANQVAHALVERGVRPDTLVGIYLEPSAETVIAMLAILKAGGAYVPLSATLPEARIQHMLSDGGVGIILTRSGLRERLAYTGVELLVLDQSLAAYSNQNLTPSSLGLEPSHLAYVLYTSGTTGQPKGVMISHGAAVNFGTALLDRLALPTAERWLLLTATTFDIAFFEWFGCLQMGGTVVVADEACQFDAAELRRFLEANRFQLVQATPSRWTQLIDAGWVGQQDLVALAGGEPLTFELQQKMASRVGVLWNGYGPTEATVYTCNHKVDPNEPLPHRLSIGTGLRNYEHYILSAHNEPVAIGAIGELHIAGPSLGRGYLNRPELTAEKFITVGDTRLYKTGDLVRFLPNGDIGYIGRTDDQVKIRGFRIELGEIEAQLRRVVGVREGVVLARGKAAGKYLAAYIVAEGELAAADENEWRDILRQSLKQTLPEYMVPAAFVRLSAFPLNSNGKVDKKALPEPERQLEHDYIAPSTTTEERLATIWQEILKIDAVSVTANFFELGGHSLLATRIASAVSEAFGTKMPVRALFEHNTVRTLSAWLDQQSVTGHHDIPVADRSEPLPLSFAQQRLWFVDQFEEGSVQYNMPAALRLKGTLDRAALQAAFDTIIERHEVLRTRFIPQGESPVQDIRPSEPLPMRVHDLSGLAEGERDEALARLIREELGRPFDLRHDLMLRVTLVRLGADEHALLFNMHHIASDGWSTEILIHELTVLYGAFVRGETSPLAPLPIQYADYAQWQREQLQGVAFEQHLAYWKKELADLPPVHSLPLDKPRPAQQRFDGSYILRTIDRELLQRLEALAESRQASLFMILQSAFALLIGRWSHSNDVVIGSPIAGREHRDLEPLIGFFINTLAIRTRLSGRASFLELLEQTKQTSLDAYAHQAIPFEKLVEEIGAARSLSHGPLFQIALSQVPELSVPELPQLDMTVIPEDRVAAKFDLNLLAARRGETLELNWTYATSLFEAVSIERMAAGFETLLRAIAAAPERAIDALPLTEEPVTVEGAEEVFPASTIHELFEAQVLRAPDTVAAICGEDELTYEELNGRANQLAHLLLSKGVTAGELVALRAERSIDNVVGTLAILKAGAAYLPLDPAYPEERSRFMLEDGGVRFLLTQMDLLEEAPLDLVQAVVLDMPVLVSKQPESNPSLPAQPSDLAYVMYTSGSTGQPKGVMVEHHGVVRLAAGNHYVPLTAETRMLQAASCAFDAATFEIWGALLNGGCLVIYPESLLDLTVLNQQIDAYHVDTMWLTAGLFEQWSHVLPRGGSLRHVLAGGDVISPAAVARVYAAMPEVAVINGYGPTENTTFTTCYTVPRIADLSQPIPLGVPINGTSVYVLDSNGMPLPHGAIGELHAGGAGLARGYHNRPELTAEKFITIANTRLYKTGDLVRFLPDGNLAFIGRIDDQVKIRGFRIEPGEIETQLLRVEGVREAAVLVKGSGSDKYLAAYVVADLTIEALRHSLQQTLPGYMMPAAFVLLPSLPLNANGKVDRHALPEPERQSEEAYVAPSTETETRLAAIWKEVLKLDAEVSVTGNFFELGGDSLLATRIASVVSQAFDRTLPVRALFEHNSVRALARHLEQQAVTTHAAIPVADRTRPLPLSFAQQRLWFIDQLEEGSAQYNMPGALRLQGSLDRAAMQATFDAIIARHEVLRTRFVTQFANNGDEAIQQIVPAEPVSLRFADLTLLEGNDRETAVQRLAEEEAARPFDLTRDLMLRVVLVQLAEEEHVLLFTMHHIASDGWSLDVLVSEFAALYTAYSQPDRCQSPLTPLPIQYADYAAWQRAQLEGEAYDRHVDYWRVQLAGIPPVHSLPLDKPRPAHQRFEGGTVKRTIDGQLLAQLEELAHSHRATLFMVLQSAFALLLGRWSRNNDIVMGSPIAGREHRDLDPLIGFFVNTLVLRTRLSETQSFHALLEEAKQTALDAYAHQAIPFETLVDELKPERSLGHGALFQIMFSLLKGTAELPQLPNLELSPLGRTSSLTKFDLNLTAIEGEQQLSLQWHYATSLFERESIERMAAGFELLLRGIVATPERPVYALPITTDVIRSKGPEADRSNEPCVHVAFETQVAATPDAIAVIAGERTLTYGALNEQANRLAHALLAKALPARARVGFYVERSPEALVSMLGILKAGMTYVPFEPSNTAERLQHIITNGEIECVAVQASLAAKLPAGLKLIVLDEELPYATHNPAVAVSVDDSAYVMYTSGSTGVPKGVEITHAGLLDYCAFASRHYYNDNLSGSFVVTSHGFDITVPSLYVPLLRGGSVHLTAPGEELLALAEMLSANDDRTYLLRMTPMHVTGALSLLPADLAQNDAHVFVIGGEAFPATLAQELQSRFPKARIYNHYGPTETVVGCSIFDVTAALQTDSAPAARLPIGRAMENHELYVLNEAQQLAPVGVAGELCIGGAGVAKGYVNQPEVTAAKFIANPFGEGWLYRSGDVVRMLPSGDLEFLGRVDDQIKVRGFRIEPGEIEATLKQTVKDALVVVQGEEENKALVAYVIGEDDTILPELKARLAKALPDYMIPTGWCVLSAFPLNANGKIDRKALPVVIRQAVKEHVEPSTPSELLLAGLWQTVLKLQTSPSVTANFFELGGHSLLATRVASAVSQSFEKKIPVRALFEHSTIRALAAHLDRLSQSAHHAIVPADRSQELPLSFAQQRLWFLDQLTGKTPQYNMPAAFRLRGRLDGDALQKSLDEIVRRHEILRTTYVADLGTARQIIHDARSIVITPADLTSLDPAARELRVQELAKEEARTPFDLSTDLMVRARLLTLSDTDHVLLFTMHHIASDGWSMGVLVREFGALYEAFSSGKTSPLAPLAVQYADYATWQRQWLQGDVLEGQLAYWRTQLADLPPVHRLPLDKPRPAVQGFAGARRVQLLDPALHEQLNGLARSRNASLYMLLQSALALLVGRWSNESDIVIGNTIAGRTHKDVESLIGFFVNNVVLRTDLSAAGTFDELLEQVKRTSLDAHVNQDIPFEMLVDELKVERSLSHSPLVQLVFTFRNNEVTDVRLPDLSIENAADTFSTSRFDLELLVTELPDGLQLSWAYSTDVFEQPTIERLGASFEVLLRNVVAAPAAPLQTIDVMTEADRKLLAEWEQPDVAFPEHLTIHELFEQHAAATPDATAIVFNEEEMTYGELNAAANRLAHYLVDKNVKPDSRVGICVERSLDMLVGILGILKAGGAYVPIDPNYPQERIEHILQDSGLSLVLTQGELLQLSDAFSDYPTMPIDAGFRNVLLARYSDQNLDNAALGVTPRNMAYVIYTSGSTGTPKGVMVEHRGVVRLVINNHYVPLSAETRMLQSSTSAFDAATFEMWGALLNGGQLILYPESRIDLKVLNQQVDEHRVNTLWLTTGLFEQWSYELPKRGSLEFVITGGEVMTPAAIERVYSGMDDVVVINAYGPTENTTFSTCHTVPRTSDFSQPVSLGTKINGTSLHILDHARRPLPTGAIGELYLGGPGLARGYLNRDELTAEKFVETAWGRLYRTGDLVHYLPDGTLAFIGRADDQVKIRGFRIELGEIEAHITRIPGIRDAVVLALGEGTTKYLAAYVVPAGEWDEAALRQALKQSLPDHMLPTAYVVLPSLPLNANGKVDKKALPEPDRQGHDGYVAPSTETEKQIAGIWQEILKLEQPVSANAHFFDLGGNSLSLIRVKAYIERAFELEVPTRLFFEYPTVTGIALATDLLRTKNDVALELEGEEMEVGEL